MVEGSEEIEGWGEGAPTLPGEYILDSAYTSEKLIFSTVAAAMAGVLVGVLIAKHLQSKNKFNPLEALACIQ